MRILFVVFLALATSAAAQDQYTLKQVTIASTGGEMAGPNYNGFSTVGLPAIGRSSNEYSEEVGYVPGARDTPTDVHDDLTDTIPSVTRLLGAQPNPFNPVTTIHLEIAAVDFGKRVQIDVFDVRGRHLDTLLRDEAIPGRHGVIWNGRGKENKRLSSGIYLARLTVGSNTHTIRIVLLK